MLRQEGFFALWRGNVPTILIQGGTSALNFMFLDLYKKAANQLVQQDQRFLKSLVSGALAGGTAIAILYPIGLVRTKLALDVGQEKRLYPQAMRDVVRHSVGVNWCLGSLPGLRCGISKCFSLSNDPFGGIRLCQVRALFSTWSTVIHRCLELAVCGTLLGGTSRQHVGVNRALSLGSVRRRLMMQADVKDEKYRNAIHCFVQIYRDEGIPGYFRGLGTNCIRTVGGALLLVSYDFFKTLLS